MKRLDLLTSASVLLTLAACYNAPQSEGASAQPPPEQITQILPSTSSDQNRNEDITKVENLNGNTTTAEDAAKESTPGNRKPIGMDGMDTTK